MPYGRSVLATGHCRDLYRDRPDLYRGRPDLYRGRPDLCRDTPDLYRVIDLGGRMVRERSRLQGHLAHKKPPPPRSLQ